MQATIQISIDHRQSQRLQRLAMQYGLSLTELATKILTEVSSEIGIESLQDYQQSRSLSASLKRAWKDLEEDRISATL